MIHGIPVKNSLQKLLARDVPESSRSKIYRKLMETLMWRSSFSQMSALLFHTYLSLKLIQFYASIFNGTSSIIIQFLMQKLVIQKHFFIDAFLFIDWFLNAEPVSNSSKGLPMELFTL